MDPNESESADFEPDDDLLESLPADEAGGTGPDEPTDPTQPDDGEGKGPMAAIKRHRQEKRGRDITDQPAYGFWLVVIALGLVAAAFIVAVLHYDNPKAVVTVMGVLTGIVGALVGAFFGVRGATYAALVHRERSDATERHGDRERRDDEGRHGSDHRDRHTPRRGHERGG